MFTSSSVKIKLNQQLLTFTQKSWDYLLLCPQIELRHPIAFLFLIYTLNIPSILPSNHKLTSNQIKKETKVRIRRRFFPLKSEGKSLVCCKRDFFSSAFSVHLLLFILSFGSQWRSKLRTKLIIMVNLTRTRSSPSSSSFAVFILIVAVTSLLLNCWTSVESKSIISKVKKFENEVKAGHDLNYESPTFLTRMITHIFEAFNLKQVLHDIKISKTTDATCHTCKFGIGLLQHLLEFGKSKEEVAHLALTICTTLKVESPRVCKGIVESYRVIIFLSMSKLSPNF